MREHQTREVIVTLGPKEYERLEAIAADLNASLSQAVSALIRATPARWRDRNHIFPTVLKRG